MCYLPPSLATLTRTSTPLHLPPSPPSLAPPRQSNRCNRNHETCRRSSHVLMLQLCSCKLAVTHQPFGLLHTLDIPLSPFRGAGKAEAFGATAVAAEVDHTRLKQMLTYPADWGPTDWGPIPFLPDPDVLVSSMERQWGDLAAYRGIATSASGGFPLAPLSPTPAHPLTTPLPLLAPVCVTFFALYGCLSQSVGSGRCTAGLAVPFVLLGCLQYAFPEQCLVMMLNSSGADR